MSRKQGSANMVGQVGGTNGLTYGEYYMEIFGHGVFGINFDINTTITQFEEVRDKERYVCW